MSTAGSRDLLDWAAGRSTPGLPPPTRGSAGLRPYPGRHPLLAAALLLLAAGALGSPATAAPQPQLAQAHELLEAEEAEKALEVLDAYLAEHPQNAEALMLRSTGRLMLGEIEQGRADLERSLELDPKQRQGWLNLGAVAIADKRYEDALEAFGKAESLDPAAPDNNLNIGAVLLLSGNLSAASERFATYLAAQGSADAAGAEAYYLVATNYALAGYAALAVEHLRGAIQREERARLRARTDPNFTSLANNPLFEELLATDPWKPAPGAYATTKSFDVPWEPHGGRLLAAVLDTLQLSGFLFDPRVEVTARWALIWGELRIKVTSGADGSGRVEVSAPADQLTPKEWRESTERLFRGIEERLILSRPATEPEPEGERPARPR